MKKIVLIDDTPALLEEIEDILKMEGFDVIIAKNGKEGLKEVKKNKPDVIVSDLVMPEMNGFELLKSIKSMSSLNDIPFLFISAQANKQDYNKAKNLGAYDYITKPCSAEKLLSVIKSSINE